MLLLYDLFLRGTSYPGLGAWRWRTLMVGDSVGENVVCRIGSLVLMTFEGRCRSEKSGL